MAAMEWRRDGPRSQSELAQFFPPLLWLLRDLVVDLTTDGKQVDEREYMEAALAAGHPQPGARRSATRCRRGAHLPRRSCRTWCAPRSTRTRCATPSA